MRTDRPLTLSVTEAGNLLGVSRSTAYELVRSGELESVKLRRRVVVPVAAIADRLGITVADVWSALCGRPAPKPDRSLRPGFREPRRHGVTPPGYRPTS